MRIGFTGHRQVPIDLPERLDAVMRRVAVEGCAGVTCLAEGADQAFADALLTLDRDLDVIVPFASYEETFSSADARRHYNELLERAARITVLPYPDASESAFLAAGLVIVERSELLLAVWDGLPANGLGGTADVLAYARARGRRVEVISVSR